MKIFDLNYLEEVAEASEVKGGASYYLKLDLDLGKLDLKKLLDKELKGIKNEVKNVGKTNSGKYSSSSKSSTSVRVDSKNQVNVLND